MLTAPIATIAFAFAIITGGLLALFGVVAAFRSADNVGRRLGTYANIPGRELQRESRNMRLPLNRMRSRLNSMLSIFVSPKLNMQLVSANWPITETEYILIRFWVTVAGFVSGWALFQSPFSGIGLAALLYIAPAVYLNRSVYNRRIQFEHQLVDVLVLLTGAVRAGYSLSQSLDFVIQEMKAPASEEFRRVQYEVNLGLPLNQALTNLVHRMDNDDLYLLVTAININSQVGGNLVTMLRSVTNTVRERVRLFGEVRMLTAQQRFSSYVLTLIPFGIAAILFLLNPEYIKRLFEPGIWLCFPIGALISIILGNIVIQRMAKIEV